jgi:hypothetical protein
VLFEGIGFPKSKGHGSGNGEASVPGEERLRRGEPDGVVPRASTGSNGN